MCLAPVVLSFCLDFTLSLDRIDLCISEQARDNCPPLPGTHRAGLMRETFSWLSGLGAQGWAFGKEGPG